MGEHALRVDAIHDHELGPARRARDEADVAFGHVELVGDEPEQGLVRGTLDRRHRHPCTQDTVGDPVDVVGTTTGRETDGKADVDLAQDNLRVRRA